MLPSNQEHFFQLVREADNVDKEENDPEVLMAKVASPQIELKNKDDIINMKGNEINLIILIILRKLLTRKVSDI